MDFGSGDGWVISQDYAMHVPPHSLSSSMNKVSLTSDWKSAAYMYQQTNNILQK